MRIRFAFAAALLAVPALACQNEAATEMAKGNVLVNKGDLEQAVKAYQAACALAPARAEPRLLLGNALFDLKRYGEAKAAYEDGLAREPGTLEPMLGLARVAALQGNKKAAAEQLSQVLELQPQNLFARLSRANLELDLGQAQAAEEDGALAVQGAPKSKEALHVYGRSQLAQGKLPEAAATFRKLEVLAPGSALGPYGLAQVAARRGEKDAALAQLKAALTGKDEKLDPAQVAADPAFGALAGDPAFAALLR